MHFLPISLMVLPAALAAAVVPRDNACFSMDRGVCLGRTAASDNALIAINNACSKIATCTPGQTNSGRITVTGKVSGFPYTATLRVGDQCAGVAVWSQDACVGLFSQFVDVRCAPASGSPAGAFQLGYVASTCDDSLVSFNLGG